MRRRSFVFGWPRTPDSEISEHECITVCGAFRSLSEVFFRNFSLHARSMVERHSLYSSNTTFCAAVPEKLWRLYTGRDGVLDKARDMYTQANQNVSGAGGGKELTGPFPCWALDSGDSRNAQLCKMLGAFPGYHVGEKQVHVVHLVEQSGPKEASATKHIRIGSAAPELRTTPQDKDSLPCPCQH